MADGWLASPGHGEQHIAPFALQDVVNRKSGACFEHAPGFGINFVLASNVHRHVNGHRRVELAVGKRQLRRVPLPERDVVAQADPVAQCVSGLAKGRCQVDAGYAAIVGLGKRSRRASQAASDVEDMGVGVQVE